eukprot:4418461-Karenia_brevis.AAC.1
MEDPLRATHVEVVGEIDDFVTTTGSSNIITLSAAWNYQFPSFATRTGFGHPSGAYQSPSLTGFGYPS